MKYWKLILPELPAAAMALYPFMLFKEVAMMDNLRLIRHEQIHFKQQLELLILPFYVLYLLFYLINLIKYRSHTLAYNNICFEKEAYHKDADPAYLKNRKCYAWLSYL